VFLRPSRRGVWTLFRSKEVDASSGRLHLLSAADHNLFSPLSEEISNVSFPFLMPSHVFLLFFCDGLGVWVLRTGCFSPGRDWFSVSLPQLVHSFRFL